MCIIECPICLGALPPAAVSMMPLKWLQMPQAGGSLWLRTRCKLLAGSPGWPDAAAQCRACTVTWLSAIIGAHPLQVSFNSHWAQSNPHIDLLIIFLLNLIILIYILHLILRYIFAGIIRTFTAGGFIFSPSFPYTTKTAKQTLHQNQIRFRLLRNSQFPE